MDRLQVALLTVGVWLVLLAGLAALHVIGQAVRRAESPSGTAGLLILALFFLMTLLVVLGLTRSDLASAIPAPPTPAAPVTRQ